MRIWGRIRGAVKDTDEGDWSEVNGLVYGFIDVEEGNVVDVKVDGHVFRAVLEEEFPNSVKIYIPTFHESRLFSKAEVCFLVRKEGETVLPDFSLRSRKRVGIVNLPT